MADPGTLPGGRVLVTGTSGFIASHLAAALVRRGYRMLNLDRVDPPRPLSGVEYVRCDIREPDRVVGIVRQFAPVAVLHLAARTDLDETRDLSGYAANTVGVEHLLRAIAATPSVQRAVCTSSQLVCRLGYTPTHAEDFQPSTLYGESKVQTERIWRREDGAGRGWCLVRPTTIWGPWMNPHYLRFFRMIQRGRYRHIGKGPTLKSYGYVGNTVWQYLRLLEAPAEAIARRVFYLADYEPLVLEQWAEAFRRALHAPPIRSMPMWVARGAARVGDLINLVGVRRFPFNSFRLRNVLTPSRLDLSSTRAVCGESPYTMEQGVAETARWLREQLAR
jgi:nucleoside-diphosphate-sugar epimerase